MSATLDANSRMNMTMQHKMRRLDSIVSKTEWTRNEKFFVLLNPKATVLLFTQNIVVANHQINVQTTMVLAKMIEYGYLMIRLTVKQIASYHESFRTSFV